MNQRALDRTRFESIEAYVLGTMSGKECQRFEQEMATDTALRSEVALQREHMLAIELGGFSRTLKEVGAEQAREDGITSSSGWRSIVKYAAAVALLIAGSLWWMSRPSTNERLFAKHYTADPGLPVTMSASDDHAFQDAMVAYKLGEYEEARDKWASLLQAEPESDTLRYYIASACLAMDDHTAAIPLLVGVAGDGASAFRNKAQWFLFLAYLKNGDVERMKPITLDDDPIYGDRVRAIRAELK